MSHCSATLVCKLHHCCKNKNRERWEAGGITWIKTIEELDQNCIIPSTLQSKKKKSTNHQPSRGLVPAQLLPEHEVAATRE